MSVAANKHSRLSSTVVSSLYLLARLARRRASRALEHSELSEAMALPIVYVRRLGEGVRQNALAESLNVEGPSLVRLLDHLSATGLLERREDATDRRAKTLHLTADGRALADRVEKVLESERSAWFAEVSTADLEATNRVFAALEKALRQVEQDGKGT